MNNLFTIEIIHHCMFYLYDLPKIKIMNIDSVELEHEILMMGQNLSLTNGKWEKRYLGRFKIDDSGKEADVWVEVTTELIDP